MKTVVTAFAVVSSGFRSPFNQGQDNYDFLI